jgi:hypothetical protein
MIVGADLPLNMDTSKYRELAARGGGMRRNFAL